MHYLLFYEVADDYVARRGEFREAHLRKAWAAVEHGELVLGGALDPADGAVLLFRGDSAAVAEDFARTDPYVVNGLVKRWRVRPWTTVAGKEAAMPVRPESMPAVLPGREPHADAAILRMWKARSTTERAGEYAQFVTRKVFPKLRAIAGHRGAYLLRRAAGDAVEVMVLTLWESMAAVRRFAGAEPDKAVVEPEARAVLSSFDDSVTHFEIVHGPETPRE